MSSEWAGEIGCLCSTEEIQQTTSWDIQHTKITAYLQYFNLLARFLRTIQEDVSSFLEKKRLKSLNFLDKVRATETIHPTGQPTHPGRPGGWWWLNIDKLNQIPYTFLRKTYQTRLNCQISIFWLWQLNFHFFLMFLVAQWTFTNFYTWCCWGLSA